MVWRETGRRDVVPDPLGVGFLPRSDRASTSRSGRILDAVAAGSWTTAALTRRPSIARLGGRNVRSGPIVSTLLLMPSRTCMAAPPRTRMAGRPYPGRPGLPGAGARRGTTSCCGGTYPRPDDRRGAGRVAAVLRTVAAWLTARFRPAVRGDPGLGAAGPAARRGAGISGSGCSGSATWLLLPRCWPGAPLVRAQVVVVVAFATVVEYTFSPLLDVYVYRLDNVPAFVPPGHGLVYLGALAIGRRPAPRRTARAGAAPCWSAALTPARAVVATGPTRSAPSGSSACSASWPGAVPDAVRRGVRRRHLPRAVGTRLGTWAWQPPDPTGLVTIGNPPSGAAGGYGWFDLAAVLAGPAVLAACPRRRQPSPPDARPSRPSGGIAHPRCPVRPAQPTTRGRLPNMCLRSPESGQTPQHVFGS